MEIRHYRDPESGLPHIYDHGVTEAEVEWILAAQAKTKPVPTIHGRHWGKRNPGVFFGSFMSLTKKETACL
jgi:hypothetical protein